MARESSKQQQQAWRTMMMSYDSNFPGSGWPPRSYPCSFCKREFRSAQALGGHMNVHRRDRARLRINHDASSSSPPHLPPPPPATTTTTCCCPTSRAAAIIIPNLNYPPPPAPAVSLELRVGVAACSSSSTAAPATPPAGGTEDDGLDLELRLGV